MSTTSGGSGKRAFAQKLSRYQAADVRRRVAATASLSSADKIDPFNRISTATRHSAISVPGSVSGLTIASRESSVEPPDYEDILEQYLEVLCRDPLKDVLKFPDDDVEVVCVPRRCRTVVPLLPEIDPQHCTVEPRLSDCVRSYTRDWIAVHRRYQQHSSSLVSPRQSYERMTVLNPPKKQEYEIDLVQSAGGDDDDDEDGERNGRSVGNSTTNSCRSSVHMDEETPRGSWASSIFDLRNSVADPLIQGILDSTLVPGKNNNSPFEPRQNGRHEMLFSLYPPSAFEEPLEKRLPADIPSEHAGHKILIKIHQMKLELEVEPIFATMALYDVKERKKISENFHFDLNSDALKSMLGVHLKAQDPSTFSKSCVFDLSSPSPDIYLIIRLEKVLQGDINECVEPYMKDDKNRDKVRANAVAACERLGRYRMPFAWTYISLMHVINPNNTAASSSQSSGGTLDSRDSGSEKGSANSSLGRRWSLLTVFASRES